MTRHAVKPVVLSMLAGCGLTLALGAGLQPAPDDTAPPPADPPLRAPREGAPRGAMDADTVRERFVDLRVRTDEAIAALDAGTEPREVMRTFVDDSPVLQFLARGPRGPRPDAGGPPSDAVRRHLAEHAPELNERLKHLEETDPDLAKKFLDRLGERFGDSIGEDADDPELANLKAAEFEASMRVFDTTRRLRDPLRDGSISEPDARAKLAEVLGAHLDARQAVAQHEIDRLRERLASTERDVNAFDERRADEIAQMTDRIMTRLRSDAPQREGRGRRGRGPDERRRGPGG